TNDERRKEVNARTRRRKDANGRVWIAANQECRLLSVVCGPSSVVSPIPITNLRLCALALNSGLLAEVSCPQSASTTVISKGSSMFTSLTNPAQRYWLIGLLVLWAAL